MIQLFKTLFLLFLTLPVFGQEGNSVSAFAKANKAYTSENYELAIAAYNQILSTDSHSPELYFNLGNAHYKMNQVGPAIYHYEKALQLKPNDPDILNNLRLANQMKIDAIEGQPEDVLGSSWDEFVKSLSVDEWAYASILLVLFSILMSIFYLYAQGTGKKRLFFVLTLLGVMISAFVISVAFYAKNHLDQEQFAIVYVEAVSAKEEPKENAADTFEIHEGTKVQVLETFEGWNRIELANGNRAWLPVESIKKL